MSYDAQSSSVRNVQLKAQKLSLKFEIVGNATPASKTKSVDDPSVLFLRLEGQDDITEAAGALDVGQTAPTYTDAANDASGIINCLVKISEPVKKILNCKCSRQSTTISEADDVLVVSLGDADGIDAEGDKILLTIDGAALTSGTHSLCLEVEYSVDEQA